VTDTELVMTVDRTTVNSAGRSAAPSVRGFEGQILMPGDAVYDQARSVWNAIVDRRPAIIMRCTSASDVAAAVRFGREQSMDIGVRGGGHSVLGLSIPAGGLMVDLSPLGAVRVDPDRRRAWVEGGALLGALDRATQPFGLATTAGNVSHTGVGGLTLGGGMGWLARRFGLACDNAAGFEVVAADGSILRATEVENPDLFWGLRGGGGNFGVVTGFEFDLHPVGTTALIADLFYAPAEGAKVLQRWRDLIAEAPREATLTAWSGVAGEWPWLSPEHRGQHLTSVGFAWVGDPDRGRQLVSALHNAARPVAERVEELTYLELQSIDDERQRHHLRRYWKGHYLREFGNEAIDAFVARGVPSSDDDVDPTILPIGGLQSYGGAISSVGNGDTAFSHRDTLVEFVAVAGWADPAEDHDRMSAARRYAAAIEPFASGVYVNDLADEGAAGVRRAYGSGQLARLTALKDRYDPDNVFHLNHNIPPTAQAAG
jgi:FAD/FMN-containing dehydrogenase